MAELDQVKLTAVYLSIRCMEFGLVGTGIGGGIKDTKELKVLNYKKAMQSPNADEWHNEIRKELEQFDKYNTLIPVPRSLLPKGSKVLTTTWAFKMKSNCTCKGRFNARGYEQVDGCYYA